MTRVKDAAPPMPDGTDELLAEAAQEKAAGGRPRKEIPWEVVRFLANLGATQGEIAAALNLDVNTLTRGANAKVFQEIYAGGVLRANVSIRRVLFGTLRGQLTNPVTGAAEEVPQEERIAMAKYLANRKVYLNLEEAAQDVTSGGKPLGDGVSVVTVTIQGDPEKD